MKDRLTKKRVRVDYEAIIKLLDLSTEFRYYQIKKHSLISERRQMLSFLRSRSVDIFWCYHALQEGITNIVELTQWCGSYKAAMEYAYGM